MQHHIHRTWLILCLVVLGCCLFGCDRTEDIPVVSVAPETTFPCWHQSWRCGEWVPLTFDLTRSDYIVCEPDPSRCTSAEAAEGVFYISKGLGGTVRIIDPERGRQRLMYDSTFDVGLELEEWDRAISTWSMDPILEGDLLFIVCHNQLWVIHITQVGLGPKHDLIRYRIAKVDDGEGFPPYVSLVELGWGAKEERDRIGFDKRWLNVDVLPFVTEGRIESRRYMTFQYDNYYGYYTGAPMPYPDHVAVAHIAIAHKGDYEEDDLIDLRSFRFKTWEDGLGNRCEAGTGSQ